MAAIPTLLYYWSIFTMVELDARKFGAKPIANRGRKPVESDAQVRLSFRLA